MNPAHVLPDHDIAVVIVNYNSAEMSLNAMQSIFDKTADTNSIHIHVVDNASPDDCATVLRKEISARGWASQTTLYEETINHGFGRGNNVALNAIAAMDQKPEKAMFLNPDACMQSDVIASLSKRLDQLPDVAIAGSAIRDECGEVAVAAFRFPNILGVFADAVNFGPISGLFANWRAPIEPMPTTETDVDWVTGAAFMARFDSIERVGFFNQNFFLYFEEVDLMKAVRADGGRIIHIPDAIVEHIGGAVTEQDSAVRARRPAYWYDSWTWYFLSNHGRAYTALTSVGWLVGAAVDGVISTLRRKQPQFPKRFFRDFMAISLRRQLGGGVGDPRSNPESGS